jgi:hypothetical protein
MRKINIVILLLISITTIKAQVNYFELSNKLMYFGISMGFTGGDYKLIPAPTISRKDSIYNFKTIVQPGFNLGIIGNLQVHKYFDIRLIPSLVFTDRRIQYAMNDGTKINKQVQHIYISLPLEFRYKSKPIKDFRLFIMSGIRYDFDLNSNNKKRGDPLSIKVKPHDLCFEYGIGFQYYFTYFIISPEFKMSHGLLDIKGSNEGLIQQRVIDKIFSRAFTITINFEG